MTVFCCCTLKDVWFIYTYLSHRCLNTQSGHKRNEILMRWGKRKGENAFVLQLCMLSAHLNHWRSLFSGWLLDKHLFETVQAVFLTWIVHSVVHTHRCTLINLCKSSWCPHYFTDIHILNYKTTLWINGQAHINLTGPAANSKHLFSKSLLLLL